MHSRSFLKIYRTKKNVFSILIYDEYSSILIYDEYSSLVPWFYLALIARCYRETVLLGLV